MIDLCTDVYRIKPSRLARMFGSRLDEAGSWQPNELEAILHHQMTAPLEVDLGRTATLASCKTRVTVSFAELLRTRHPRLELLEGVKDFAKSQLRKRNGQLPREIARLLYIASVLVARLRCGVRISRQSDEQLRLGCEWALHQSWIVTWLVELFEEGRAHLDSGSDRALG